MGYSHKRNIRASCEDCPQSGRPVCSQVFDQRGGEPLIVRLIVIVVPRLMLSVGFTLRGLHQFLLVLGPHESAIDDRLTVVFERHDCTS